MDGLEQAPMWGIFGIILGALIYLIIGKKHRKKINIFFYILFCYYVARVLSLTLLPLPLSEMSKQIYREFGGEMINIIPLIEGLNNFNSHVLTQWLLNIIMFFPLGFLIPLSFKKEYNFKKIIILSFLFSLFIEISQLSISYFWIGSGYRLCDINDLIFNTIGGLSGYCIITLLIKILRKKREKYENQKF